MSIRLKLVAPIACLCVGVALTLVSVPRPDGGAQPPLSQGPAFSGAGPSASPATAAFEEPTVAPTEVPGGPIPSGYRVQIPRLGIDLPVQEGDLQRDVDEQRTPEGYAFHLPGTAIPGQHSNTFLYAHARRGMFLALWNVRPGDEVLVRVPDGAVLAYVVRDILPHVAPTDVSTTWPTASERLTLQTSTGPDPGDPRFVVLAYPRVE